MLPEHSQKFLSKSIYQKSNRLKFNIGQSKIVKSLIQ